MKWAIVLVLAAGVGCGGDELAAPRLARRTSNLVPPAQLAFDADNRPIALLAADVRQKLARLTPQGWQEIEGANQLDVRDLGTDADGTPLFTVAGGGDSALFQLGPNDRVLQLGGRIPTAAASSPFQSPWGDLFVSTIDGGRRLVYGSDVWALSKTLTQVVRDTDGVLYGMGSDGLVRMEIDARDGTGTTLVPCNEFPVACKLVTLAGIDGAHRLWFTVETGSEVFVLDAGATALRPLTIAGARRFGSVQASPRFTVVEVIGTDDGDGDGDDGDDDDAPHYLFLNRPGSDRFELVDLRVRPELDTPLFAVDRDGTIFVSDGDWLGTVELD